MSTGRNIGTLLLVILFGFGSFLVGRAESGGIRLTEKEKENIIRFHKEIRAEVGVGSVGWSPKIALYAQEWAEHLASSGCRMRHRSSDRYGENIYWSSKDNGAEQAVIAWAEEKEEYHGQVLDKSNWYETGHYTQLVWNRTKEIGCGKAQCRNGRIMVVCNYDPPGNFIGEKPY